MQFKCASPGAQRPDEPCTVSLHQVGDDVDILVNGVQIGWFNAACGRLGLAELPRENLKPLADQGMKFNPAGEIETY